MGYSPLGCKEMDTIERLTLSFLQSFLKLFVYLFIVLGHATRHGGLLVPQLGIKPTLPALEVLTAGPPGKSSGK